IPLYRNLARAFVYVDGNSEASKTFELIEYNIWNGAPSAYAAAGLFQNADNTNVKTTFPQVFNKGLAQEPNGSLSAPNYVYAYPQSECNSLHDPSSDNRAFMIVKGNYNGKETFYRIDFRTASKEQSNVEGEAVKFDYFLLQPNHEYQVKIVKVKREGYSSAEEAARHPQTDFIVAEIHDHVPAVLSMTSDGVRELGVASSFVSDDNAVDGAFTMRLFSKVSDTEYPELFSDLNASIYDNNKGFTIEVIEGKEWLKLDNLIEAGEESINEPGDSHAPQGGKVYKVGMKFASSFAMGVQTGRIRVSWRGLSREVRVVWNNTFDVSDLVEAAELFIRGGDSSNPSDQFKTGRYFDWLKNNAGSDYENKVFGVEATNNIGNGQDNDMTMEVRNEGIHLPLAYGGKDSQWKYEYTLTFDVNKLASKLQQSFSSFDYRFEMEGAGAKYNDLLKNRSSVDGSGSQRKIVINPICAELGTEYYTGKLIITINGEDLPGIDVYHTGFFHLVAPRGTTGSPISHAVTNKNKYPDAGWYYYEVRSFGDRLWLDRNIMAKGSGMEIQNTSGQSIVSNRAVPFNPNAAGGYFKPAKWVPKGNVEDNIYSELCPPGFRIPTTNEWDIIRNSSAFVTTQATAGGSTFYRAYVNDIYGNKIFLPKVGYQTTSGPDGYSGTRTGDSRAGYYWTRSEAHGLEKDQIGNWLQALMLQGESNVYMNGEVSKYGMQIRAIDDAAIQNNTETFGFNVIGATHVYIYDATEPWTAADFLDKTVVDAAKNGLMPWPGQEIGNAKTMRAVKQNGKYINPEDNGRDAREFTFTYSVNTKKENLRFVFAYVKNGKIIVFSRARHDDVNGTAKYEGWPLKGSYKFSIEDPTAEMVKYTAEIGGEGIDPEPTPPPTNKTFRLYYPKTASKLYVWTSSGSHHIFVGNDNAGSIKTGEEGDWYYKDFQQENYNSESLSWTVGKDNSGLESLNQWKAVDGKYCAWITNDAHGVGKPDMGGEDPDPVPSDKIYKLHGNFGDGWKTTDMTKSGNVWTVTITAGASSEFGIKELGANEQVSDGNTWIAGANSSAVNIGGSTACKVGGSNFKFTGAGKYTFEFDPAAMTLKVTKEASTYPQNGDSLDHWRPGDYYVSFNGEYKIWAWIDGKYDITKDADNCEWNSRPTKKDVYSFKLANQATGTEKFCIQFAWTNDGKTTEKKYEVSSFKWNETNNRWELNLGNISFD
ncbi:MAG: fibrobacter succinogenes major paralogous domain-containing protein, partial [Muribaculaceae bacterium]|nr:fibrobacter succinogenes major paralogous domain-containing protein [Muribaculaceae bacterium]